MANVMVRVAILGVTVIVMMENGRIIDFMARDFLYGQIKNVMMENGRYKSGLKINVHFIA